MEILNKYFGFSPEFKVFSSPSSVNKNILDYIFTSHSWKYLEDLRIMYNTDRCLSITLF